MWRVTVELETTTAITNNHTGPSRDRSDVYLDAIQVEHVEELYTNVADISQMSLMEGWISSPAEESVVGVVGDETEVVARTAELQILVVGVGMEMMNISIAR